MKAFIHCIDVDSLLTTGICADTLHFVLLLYDWLELIYVELCMKENTFDRQHIEDAHLLYLNKFKY